MKAKRIELPQRFHVEDPFTKVFAHGAVTILLSGDKKMAVADADELWRQQIAALREFADNMEAQPSPTAMYAAALLSRGEG